MENKNRADKIFKIVNNFKYIYTHPSDILELEDLYKIQKDNIDKYLEYLYLNIDSIDLKTFKILKSTVFLLLYNLLESTVNNSLALIHQIISDEKIKYEDLSSCLKKSYMEYFLRKQGFHNINKKQKSKLIDLFEKNFISTEHVITFPYKDFINQYNSLVAGNLDNQKINELGKIYGFKLDRNRKEIEILIVKNIRNHLGHGNISFSDCTKDMVVEDILEIKKNFIQYLEYFLSVIKNYIKKKLYINSTAMDKIN